jgi:hypothetical protein
MNMPNLPKLSTGQQVFSLIREKEQIYVDKTNFLHKIIDSEEPFWFLARPRRFGKSLLINTLLEIFLGKKELFSGLYIEDKITWEEYPVLHFDFSKIGFRDMGLKDAIDAKLKDLAKNYNVKLKKRGIGNKFSELMEEVKNKTGKQVVILIDEYDKPITDVLEVGENTAARDNRDTLRTFYGEVKGSSEFIRLFFVTGIARFARVSIFSDLNNLTDLSELDDYHNLLGYTQEELTQYFSPHLNFIAEEKNITLDELLLQVKAWYNGFSWNGKERVYNPYSILRFLQAREFKNFWFASGTPKFLIELLKKEEVYDISGIEVDISETENIDIDNLGLVTLFFQTGYLTVKEKSDDEMYTLVYPNKEVAESMQKQILANYSGKLSNVGVAKSLAKAVKNNDFVMLETAVNTLFASVPHQIFDSSQEKYFHAILFLAFKLCGYHIHCEVSTSQGRADAVMYFENRIYIFEFKLNDSAKTAIQQIHDRGYYKQFLGQNKDIYLIGINFSGKTKSVEKLLTESLS